MGKKASYWNSCCQGLLQGHIHNKLYKEVFEYSLFFFVEFSSYSSSLKKFDEGWCENRKDGHWGCSLNNLGRHEIKPYVQWCDFHRRPHSRWTAHISSFWTNISLVTLKNRHRIRELWHNNTSYFISTMQHIMLIVWKNCLIGIYRLQLLCSSWTATLGWMEAVHTLSLHTVSSDTYDINSILFV